MLTSLRARVLALCFLLFAAAPAALPQALVAGATETRQALRRLNELGTVLMIGAHPDDERTSVLAYFARGRHMRAAYLSLTRGEGGQNLIGPEQGAQLGVIRTQELLAARRIDGAEQFFTRAIDFGFSKSADESIRKWGRDRVLSDIVWVIRRYRPDVIVLCFSGTPADGHGHHQASAILAKEAFEAAADPARFPEQLQKTQPWRAKRVVFAPFGGRGQPTNNSVAIDTGAYNPVLGYSYEEIAAMGRSMHRSQAFGTMARRGPSVSQFSTVAGEPAQRDLFDGVDHSWNRLPGGAAAASILEQAIRDFDAEHPEKSVPLLAKARPIIASIADPLAKVKLAELDEAIALCAGIWADAQAAQPEAAPGARATVSVTVSTRIPADILIRGVRAEGIWSGAVAVKAAGQGNASGAMEFQIPANQPYSQPYWLAKPPAGDCYTVEDQALIGLADTPPVEQVRIELTAAGTPFEIVRPVQFRYADRAQGERVRPFTVVPAVAVNLQTASAIFPSGAPGRVSLELRSNLASASGEVRLDLPAGWKAQPASRQFSIAEPGEQREVAFEITPPAGEATGELKAVATVGGREIAAGMDVIAYPHIPTQTVFPRSSLMLVRSDVQITARRVGYIMGAGDEVPEALRQLGVEVAMLTGADLSAGDLSRFDAIVAGIRAYNVNSSLRANQQRLMEYVRNGGTYVVQYVTGDNALRIGPYPFTIPPGSNYRITVEDSPVSFPHPESPLLAKPNRIGPRDFEGWVQERGLYFASQWDPKYETVLAARDPGEQPLEGGQLWTRHGKGIYIFTAYSWFRQLPAGVPGAYRLFANLLSAK